MPSNRQQPRDESPTGDKSDCVEKPNIAESIINVYKSAFLVDEPLSGWEKFVFSWLGSSISFILGPIMSAVKDGIQYGNFPVLRPSLEIQIEESYILQVLFANYHYLLLTVVLLPTIIALVIASSKNRLGSIGLFLFSFMLTHFIINLAKPWAN